MNSEETTSKLLVKLDLDDKDLLEDALARLTKQLPASQRMIATLQMYRAFKIPGLAVYQPRESENKSNIWFAVQTGDITFTDLAIGIFCPDSAQEVDKALKRIQT